MIIKTRRNVMVVEEVERVGDFEIRVVTVSRKRSNEVETHFRNCDYCLKKIDKDGEKQVLLFEKNDRMFYAFHNHCWKHAKEHRE